jgi:endonuclease/exonuclease/phosphatase family metal-dependent hydrolase
MTYNVHRCVGCDGKLSTARVARVIAAQAPDVVCLQELDVGHARTHYHDQPAVLAGLLQMNCLFFPAISSEKEHYGDAVLSRLPLRLVRAGQLPTLPDCRGLEIRGAVWAEVECHGRRVQVVNTHLGLNRRERLAQAEALLGPDWLGHPDCRDPRLLAGDFNAWPGSAAYERLRRALRPAPAPCGTFPSRWPLLRIDHVFHGPGLVVRRAVVPRDRRARIASDHLPLVVEVSWS